MAKRIGRRVKMRENWESEKVDVMKAILTEKFKIREMQQLLEFTKGKMIVEENYWHDVFWGVCICDTHKATGSNMLGKILMNIRN